MIRDIITLKEEGLCKGQALTITLEMKAQTPRTTIESLCSILFKRRVEDSVLSIEKQWETLS